MIDIENELGYVSIKFKDGEQAVMQCDYFEASKLIPGFIDFFSDNRNGELVCTIDGGCIKLITILEDDNNFKKESNDIS